MNVTITIIKTLKPRIYVRKGKENLFNETGAEIPVI